MVDKSDDPGHSAQGTRRLATSLRTGETLLEGDRIMNPLFIVLIAWLGLSVPVSLVFGAMAGGADRFRSPVLSDRSEPEARVDVLVGSR